MQDWIQFKLTSNSKLADKKAPKAVNILIHLNLLIRYLDKYIVTDS
jgi:hypothetical protein